MVITYSTGKKDKIHILIDGEYSFTVDSDFWFSCKYSTVKELTDPEDIDGFLNEIGSRHAFLSGLRLLSYSDHSKKEMLLKLCQKGNKKEYAENAIERLEYFGYLNEERFASNLAEKLMRSKHMSIKGITQELYKRGVPRETVNVVIEEIEIDPLEEIRTLIEKKYSRYLSDEKGIRKTIAALQRLGYSYSDIKSVIRRVSDEAEEIQEDFFDD